MRQSDHEYEERSFGDIQRAIDFENSMNDLESQLYYRRLSPNPGVDGDQPHPYRC